LPGHIIHYIGSITVEVCIVKLDEVLLEDMLSWLLATYWLP